MKKNNEGKKVKKESKMTKKQALIRLLIAALIIGFCIFLGIYELKRCSNLIKRNDEVIIDKYKTVMNK